jgi:hypothetical protein
MALGRRGQALLGNVAAQQIVGRERRERVSQLLGAAQSALIRAAASTQTFGASWLQALALISNRPQ